MEPAAVHENLVFVVCSPRSGSTMLQRMIGSHRRIYTHPEPHLLTPLAYLGYYQAVDQAPYDHINAAEANRELVQELPQGEDDYLEALRAYAGTIYGKLLEHSGLDFFLDKTPAYGLILPFLVKLYPRAKYVVLTRHPLAIMHSIAHSFFAGDYGQAHRFNPIVERYVPAIGNLLRERNVEYVHVRYEDLVREPESALRRVFAHIGVEHQPDAVTYGKHQHISKSFGDPMSVEKHQRPVTDSLEKWAQDLLARPDALQMARRIVGELDPEDLQAWGYPRDTLFAPMGGQTATKTESPRLNTYALKRRFLLGARQTIGEVDALAGAVRKVRYYCDVLLRTQ